MSACRGNNTNEFPTRVTYTYIITHNQHDRMFVRHMPWFEQCTRRITCRSTCSESFAQQLTCMSHAKIHRPRGSMMYDMGNASLGEYVGRTYVLQYCAESCWRSCMKSIVNRNSWSGGAQPAQQSIVLLSRTEIDTSHHKTVRYFCERNKQAINQPLCFPRQPPPSMYRTTRCVRGSILQGSYRTDNTY